MTAAAGCLRLSRARSTGTLTGVYRAEEAGFDTEAGRYAVVCETHGALAGVDTRKDADAFAAYPANFCEECEAGEEEERNVDPGGPSDPAPDPVPVVRP